MLHKAYSSKRQELRICIVGKGTVDVDSYHDEDADVAQCAVESFTVFLSDVNYQRLLARLEVVVVVAIVVQDEQRIYYQSAGDGSQYGFAGYSLHSFRHHQVVGAADRYDAEEDQHQQVTQSQITQFGGIEEAE